MLAWKEPNMTDRTRANRFILTFAFVALILVLGRCLAAVYFGTGDLIHAMKQPGPLVVDAGSAAIVLVEALAWAGMAVVAYCLVGRFTRGQQQLTEMNESAKRQESLLTALHETNRRLVDLAQMSDAAKSLLFRTREIEAMDELLHDALMRQDYARAEALADDIGKRLGYADQVERMRQEIAAARNSPLEQRIDSAIERIAKMLEAHDWAGAKRSSQALAQLAPGHPKVMSMPLVIRNAQVRHKRDLLAAYGEAVRVGNIDRSIELLHDLDKYLTPQEGAALEESARGVFRAKLHNLGVQFSIRVTDELWQEAVQIGRQIVEEYPNSRMAQEVRGKLDTLQSLAEKKTT